MVYVAVGFWLSSRSRHVSHLLRASLLCSHLTYKPNMAQEESFGSRPEPTSDQTSLIWIHYSIGTAQLSRTPIIGTRILHISTRTLPGATQGSDTKTLRSLLLMRYFQLDITIPAIHRSNNTTRSSPRSKRCNTPISMRVVMDRGENLCMTISIIKRRDLDGYKEIITCESYNYVNPKYPHPRRQLRRV